MTREDARRLLRDGNPRERLEAARMFGELGRAEDRAFLRVASAREKDEYVRVALREAAEAIADTELPPQRARRAATDRSEIVRELTDRITHEFASVIGTLRYYAEREVVPFDASETRRELDRLDAVLDAIRQLSRAATKPVLTNIELSTFVRATTRDFQIEFPAAQVDFQGSAMTARGDEGFLSMVLMNALKNAFEAVESTGSSDPILVAWGNDDRVSWICVLDTGPGVANDVDQLAEIGVSSKDDHPGMGLSIAQEAARSLGGDIELTTRENGGARFRFEWSKHPE